MTKRIIDTIVGLFLIGILVLFALIFFNRQPPAAPTVQQPLPSDSAQAVTLENAHTTLTLTATEITAAEASMDTNLSMFPTPLPDRGVRLSEWQPLTLRGGDADFLELFRISAEGTILTAISMTNTQGLGSTIITIDLTTGFTKRITNYGPPRILYVHTSGNRIVWSEQIISGKPEQIIPEELHVYDLKSATESIVIPEGYFQMMHYKDGLAVWGGELNKIQGIHGYNFTTGKLFTIEAGAYGHLPTLPRACSNEWMIYLVTTTHELPTQSDLHARNLINGEDLVIGTVRLPRVVTYTDTMHDCDGKRVVWIETSPSNNSSQQQLSKQVKLYDLVTHTQQLIELPGSIFAVELNDSLISTGQLSGVSYDLERNIAFDAGVNYIIRSATADTDPRVEVTVSQDRWIKLQEGADGRPLIYTATIIRNP